MGINEDLKQDIYKMLDEIDTMSKEDKVKSIMLLVDKYSHLSSAGLLMDKTDLSMIKEQAAKHIVERSPVKYIETKFGSTEVSRADIPALSIIEATISFLTSKDCFRKIPKFKYTDRQTRSVDDE